ncbi:MAG: hypothetical protein H0T73_08885 [Ardenticatenales bacterium]|nr:hypothetical protein [Ardenticatenales bacterium]
MTTIAASLTTERFKTIIAFLIALVSVLGALVAWRAAQADDATGDAALAGLTSTLHVEETRTRAMGTLYQNYRGYVAHRLYNELSELEVAVLLTRLEMLPPQEREALAELLLGLAASDRDFLPEPAPRYLEPDGSYNIQRDFGEHWAEAAQHQDLDPARHFADSEQARRKTERLVSILVVLATAFLFLTLAESLEHRVRYPMALVGVILMVGGAIAALVVELS